MFFVIYRDWNFLIVLFYTSNDKKVFNRLNTYLKKKQSIVSFFIKENIESYIDLLLDRTFAVFEELFNDDHNDTKIQQYIEKIKLYQNSSKLLEHNRAGIQIDSNTQDMIKSLVYIQKSIIYREITAILTDIRNTEYMHMMKTQINELESQIANFSINNSTNNTQLSKLQEDLKQKQTDLNYYKSKLRAFDEQLELLNGKRKRRITKHENENAENSENMVSFS